MNIQKLLDFIWRRHARFPLIHSECRRARKRAVENEKCNKCPHNNSLMRQMHRSKNFAHKRNHDFNPENSEHAPKKRIKQAHSAVNIERHIAVIPRNGAKQNFLPERANIFNRRAAGKGNQKDFPNLRIFKMHQKQG